MPVFNDLAERSNNVCLELKIHCQIRLVPVADNPHALKIFTLVIDLFRRIVTTLLTKLGSGDFMSRLTHLLFNIEFNWKTVTIPPRNIRCIKTRKGFRLGNNIFENLVNGVANMQLPVRIGRPIVQNKRGLACASCAHFLIKPHALPLLEPLWLTLGQVSLHGKRCLWQV